MIDQLWKSILDANVWAVIGGIAAAVVGSSALTMWIQKAFETKELSKSFKRDVRGGAVDAAGAAYTAYMSYQTSTDEDKDINIATMQARLYADVARAGDIKLLGKARIFIQIGEKLVAQDPETSADDYDTSFNNLIDEIVKSTPS